MSASYGAPIELFSVDPLSGAETELADTSITNLLAERPVLETEANGVNLGLQLGDGTQVKFASTVRLATFLYALAVQQMQANLVRHRQRPPRHAVAEHHRPAAAG